SFVQDAQLIGHAMSPLSRDASSMQFMDRFCDSRGMLRAASLREEPRGRRACHLALKPHLKIVNRADRLADANAVLPIGSKTSSPKLRLNAKTFLIQPACAHFSHERKMPRRVSALQDVVFDQTAPARL